MKPTTDESLFNCIKTEDCVKEVFAGGFTDKQNVGFVLTQKNAQGVVEYVPHNRQTLTQQLSLAHWFINPIDAENRRRYFVKRGILKEDSFVGAVSMSMVTFNVFDTHKELIEQSIDNALTEVQKDFLRQKYGENENDENDE